MSITVLVFTGLIGVCAHVSAREVRFKDYPIEINKGDRMVISAVYGQVRLVPVESLPLKERNTLIRARKTDNNDKNFFDSLSFEVHREGNVVTVSAKGVDSRRDYLALSNLALKDAPEIFFEVRIPSIHTEVHLHSGSVFADKWKAPLAVTLTDGKVSIASGTGAVQIQLNRGEIQVSKQDGPVRAEIHSGKATIASINGPVRLYGFNVESNLQQLKGGLHYRAKAGTFSLKALAGTFQFENGRGKLNAEGIEGSVRGKTEDGPLSLGLTGLSDVSLEAVEGSVVVKSPQGQGPLIRLSSEEGMLWVPSPLKAPGGIGAKSMVARLSGKPAGQITVRSKKGNIRIY